jgi:hypothetical protein
MVIFVRYEGRILLCRTVPGRGGIEKKINPHKNILNINIAFCDN